MTWVRPASSLARASASLTGAVSARDAPLAVPLGRVQTSGRIYFVDQDRRSGDWIVGVLWCLGEVDAVEAVLLDGDPPGTDVRVETHRGDSDLVSPLIRAYRPGYRDTLSFRRDGFLHRCCHSVLRFSRDLYRTFPGFRATIRGLRIDGGVWSDDPAHMARFLIESESLGLGGKVESAGFEAAARRNRELLGGRPRRTAGVLMDSPRPVEDWIDDLAQLAGAWIYKEGAVWVCVPKAPVTAFEQVRSRDILRGGHRGDLADLRSAPTRVEIRHTDTTPRVWDRASVVYEGVYG